MTVRAPQATMFSDARSLISEDYPVLLQTVPDESSGSILSQVFELYIQDTAQSIVVWPDAYKRKGP